MSDARRLLDFGWLVAGGLALWALVAWMAGPEALSTPQQTLARVGDYLATSSFWRHARATGVAFGWACLISLVGGALIGAIIGMNQIGRAHV